jgi:hypothetical protein
VIRAEREMSTRVVTASQSCNAVEKGTGALAFREDASRQRVQVLSLQRARPVASVETEEALGEWHCGGRYRGWWLLRMGEERVAGVEPEAARSTWAVLIKGV